MGLVVYLGLARVAGLSPATMRAALKGHAGFTTNGSKIALAIPRTPPVAEAVELLEQDYQGESDNNLDPFPGAIRPSRAA